MSDLVKELLKMEKDVYLVGGALRDYFLKKPIKDLDFVIAIEASQCEKYCLELARGINASAFPLDIEKGIWRLKMSNGLQIDICPIQGAGIAEDLISRDFTINSLGIPLIGIKKISLNQEKFTIQINKKYLLDLSNGIQDIKNKKIRVVHPKTFVDDPLRMLRAFRFAYTLNFSIENKTISAIKKTFRKINDSAKERIREELLLILSSGNSACAFKEMKKCGLLYMIFPDLKKQEKCAEIYYGKGGVLKHTFRVLERMDIFFLSPQKYMPAYKGFSLNEKKIKLIKISALLHDIAKPHTAKKINGRLRFFGHEERGASISYKILKELKFSNEEIKYICKIIGQHLRIGNIANSQEITQRAMMRIYSDLGDVATGLMILSWADHASYISEKKLISSISEMKKKPFSIPARGLPKTGFKKTLRFIQVVNLIAKNYLKNKDKLNTKPILDGHEVMEILNLPPGPNVGNALRKLRFMQLEGKIKNRQEAERYLKSLKFNRCGL